MISVLIIVLIILFCVMAFVTHYFYKGCRKYKKMYSNVKYELDTITEEFKMLSKAYKIKLKNKEKADEEISNLNDGDYTANVLNKLRKHTKD